MCSYAWSHREVQYMGKCPAWISDEPGKNKDSCILTRWPASVKKKLQFFQNEKCLSCVLLVEILELSAYFKHLWSTTSKSKKCNKFTWLNRQLFTTNMEQNTKIIFKKYPQPRVIRSWWLNKTITCNYQKVHVASGQHQTIHTFWSSLFSWRLVHPDWTFRSTGPTRWSQLELLGVHQFIQGWRKHLLKKLGQRPLFLFHLFAPNPTAPIERTLGGFFSTHQPHLSDHQGAKRARQHNIRLC